MLYRPTAAVVAVASTGTVVVPLAPTLLAAAAALEIATAVHCSPGIGALCLPTAVVVADTTAGMLMLLVLSTALVALVCTPRPDLPLSPLSHDIPGGWRRGGARTTWRHRL